MTADAIIDVRIPTLHSDQEIAWDKLDTHQFLALRCGRRYGKTMFGVTVAADFCLNGLEVGWFAPETKFLSEPYQDLNRLLAPASTSHAHNHSIRTIGGGALDFWTLENPLAGRGRRYHLLVVDEAARAKPNMIETWRLNLLPTLIDFSGGALVMSNPAGDDASNFFWQVCNQPELGFTEHYAPTHSNPLIPFRNPGETEREWRARRAAEFAKLKTNYSPLAYQQEIEARFVNWAGVAFFAEQTLLVDGRPVAYPGVCDYVFATIDTATKEGKEHDGTGVTYWARTSFGDNIPLVVLDYELVQIEGASLEIWLPNVFKRLEGLARECHARHGSVGAWIEDKSSGMILLQQAKNKNMPAQAIDSKLTSLGKTERAINISGYVHRGMVKFSTVAYDRMTVFKGIMRNHLLAQVTGFRIGDVDKLKNDDLLDTFCYGVAIALGDAEGF